MRAIAIKIPAIIRSEKLLTADDPIGTAVAKRDNKNMLLLWAIWSEFVEPLNNEDLGCSLCLGRILKNFKHLKPMLEDLEMETELLKAVKR